MRSIFTRSLSLFLLTLLSCSVSSFAGIDTLMGSTTPPHAGSTYQELAHALCDGLQTETQKANAIYNWITHNIRYDVKAMQQGDLKEDDPKKVFKQRKGMCGGYALLFAAMCNEVGVKAITVSGYSRDWMFDDGDKLYIPRHIWNAVYVHGKWRLVDATWGAGGLAQVPGWLRRQLTNTRKNPFPSGKLAFRFNYDTAYFMTDPLVFREHHLPSDPIWQLADSAMPVSVFEAGVTAIKAFNKQYPERAESRPDQHLLSEMSEKERLQASEQRVSLYNPRFHVMHAARNLADAMDTLKDNAEGKMKKGVALTAVKQKLKHADEALSSQKKAISVEYSGLKSKNKTKNTQANQYIRSLHSNNERMITKCESYLTKSDTRITALKKNVSKINAKGKEINPAKLATIATTAKPEDINAPGLLQLSDSVNSRMLQIGMLKEKLAEQQQQLSADKDANDRRLDTLAGIFMLADSALRQETIGRIRMHDNYDEEVLQWNRLVKQVRFKDVDSMQQRYFGAYDTVNRSYEALRKTQLQLANLYRKNQKDLERYKRRNSNPALLAQYGDLVAEQQTYLKAGYETLSEHMVYIVNHKSLYKELIKLYRRQDKLADYMERSEAKRKDLEQQNLAKKEAFDKKENTKQKDQLKKISTKAEKALSKA